MKYKENLIVFQAGNSTLKTAKEKKSLEKYNSTAKKLQMFL